MHNTHIKCARLRSLTAFVIAVTPLACSSAGEGDSPWDGEADAPASNGSIDETELASSEPLEDPGTTDAEPMLGSSSAALLDDATFLHRFFHPDTGEHFYTADIGEASRAGFVTEVINYFGLDSFGSRTRIPFFRCLLHDGGKHLYTTSAGCEGANATNEGIVGYIATQQSSGTIPLFRLFNPSNGDHFYTTSSDERQIALAAFGYVNEGTSGFVYPP